MTTPCRCWTGWVLLAGSAVALANGANEAPVGQRLDAYMQQAAAAGFTGGVIVARDGQVLLRAGYGERTPGSGTAVSPDTVSTIGSITKQFTAAAVMLLAEKDALSVTDTLGEFFDDVPEDKNSITIHQLLSHQSGLPPAIGPDSEKIGREDWLERALHADLLFPPGEGYEYSNVGYGIAAAIVEKTSGEDYESFLRRHFFGPVGMSDTGYRLSANAVGRLAHGRDDDGGDWGSLYEKLGFSGGPGWHLVGNGGIHSTPDDMLRWHRALRDGSVLGEGSIAQLQGRHVEEPGGTWYGYGWSTELTPWGATLVTHNGGNPYFFADYLRFPADDVVIYLWTTSREARLKDIGRPLAAIVYGAPVPELPPPLPPLVRTGSGPPAAEGSYAAAWNLPGTPPGEVAAGMLTMVSSEDPARQRALIPEIIHPALLEARGVDGLVELGVRLREHLGEFRLLGIRQFPDDRVDVEFDTVKGVMALELGLADQDGLKIRSVGLRIGD